MQKFEYKVVEFNNYIPMELLQDKFNMLGADGWEYVGNKEDRCGVYIFKREVHDCKF